MNKRDLGPESQVLAEATRKEVRGRNSKHSFPRRWRTQSGAGPTTRRVKVPVGNKNGCSELLIGGFLDKVQARLWK